ncbi:tetratricopeptide repeat protein [Duncaniella freteri]|uniref:tetratricopeptide repeat protein n=1 Tax=Duncaniella freteri TaxID=2530391 RepID=UPI00256EE3DE|nr:tetratricopeptide repeat protein [Duncaniella freteri]
MNDNIKMFEDIEGLLSGGRLTAAFSVLDNAIIAYPALRQFVGELERLRQGYGYMSGYALQGLPDPGLAESYAGIVEGVRTLVEAMARQMRLKDAPTLYFNTLRYELATPGDSVAALVDEYRNVSQKISLAALAENPTQAARQFSVQAEQLEKRVFNRVWTMYPLGGADEASLLDAIADKSLPGYFKSLIISAVLMGLMEQADERRMLLLMDAYASDDADVSVRALCALLVGMWLYRNRHMSARMRNRLAALKEMPGWVRDVRMATMQYVRSRDTERITRKFNEEVIPEMMKLRPEIEKLKDKPLDTEAMEENPEWAEILEKSGVADRLKELQELQEDGGDVMMATFSKLKTFSFFNDISNWFLPFHQSHTQIASDDIPEIATLISIMGNAPMFCDNDKYSVALSLSQIPPAQRDMMLRQIRMQTQQMDVVRMAAMDSGHVPQREELAANYVRNLYRFFKLFRRKGEFTDPFSSGLNIPAIPSLEQEFEDSDTLMVIAEFYFKRGYYSDALEVFRRLTAMSSPSAAISQKMGYCEQSVGDISAALRHYEEAEMLDSSSRWTLRRLAWCHRMLGNWDKALDCYRRLAEDKPDDVSLALNIGLSLVKLHRYDEALQYLFKAEFYGSGSEKATRALAWCTLLGGDYERCVKYTATLLAGTTPRPNDYINAGHLSLLTGHPGEAVDHYVDAIKAMEGSVDSFLRRLADDKVTISAFGGVDPQLMAIVVDTSIAKSK